MLTLIKNKMEHLTTILLIVKTKFFAALIGISLFFAPIAWSLLLVGFFVILDTLFGRWAAKRIAEREGKEVRKEVSSKKTRRGFGDKTMMYMLLMGSIYILDYFMFHKLICWVIPSFPIEYIISKVMGFILVLIEADSIDEKIYNVKGIRMSTLIKTKVKTLRGTVKNIRDVKDDFLGNNKD